MGVNSLPKTVTRQRRGCDLNPGSSAPESSTLRTRLPSHTYNESIFSCLRTLTTWHCPRSHAAADERRPCSNESTFLARQAQSSMNPAAAGLLLWARASPD